VPLLPIVFMIASLSFFLSLSFMCVCERVKTEHKSRKNERARLFVLKDFPRPRFFPRPCFTAFSLNPKFDAL